MDKFFAQTNCRRCGNDLSGGRIMSMFNTDCICLKCSDEEIKRKDYKKAVEADHKQIISGNYNFKGIGFK